MRGDQTSTTLPTVRWSHPVTR